MFSPYHFKYPTFSPTPNSVFLFSRYSFFHVHIQFKSKTPLDLYASNLQFSFESKKHFSVMISHGNVLYIFVNLPSPMYPYLLVFDSIIAELLMKSLEKCRFKDDLIGKLLMLLAEIFSW